MLELRVAEQERQLAGDRPSGGGAPDA
jgi:hypothetical protein